MSHMKDAKLVADCEELPCRGYLCCESGSVEAPLYYMPGNDRAAIAAAKGKIVLLDTGVGEGGIRVRPVTVQFCYSNFPR